METRKIAELHSEPGAIAIEMHIIPDLEKMFFLCVCYSQEEYCVFKHTLTLWEVWFFTQVSLSNQALHVTCLSEEDQGSTFDQVSGLTLKRGHWFCVLWCSCCCRELT